MLGKLPKWDVNGTNSTEPSTALQNDGAPNNAALAAATFNYLHRQTLAYVRALEIMTIRGSVRTQSVATTNPNYFGHVWLETLKEFVVVRLLDTGVVAETSVDLDYYKRGVTANFTVSASTTATERSANWATTTDTKNRHNRAAVGDGVIRIAGSPLSIATPIRFMGLLESTMAYAGGTSAVGFPGSLYTNMSQHGVWYLPRITATPWFFAATATRASAGRCSIWARPTADVSLAAADEIFDMGVDITAHVSHIVDNGVHIVALRTQIAARAVWQDDSSGQLMAVAPTALTFASNVKILPTPFDRSGAAEGSRTAIAWSASTGEWLMSVEYETTGAGYKTAIYVNGSSDLSAAWTIRYDGDAVAALLGANHDDYRVKSMLSVGDWIVAAGGLFHEVDAAGGENDHTFFVIGSRDGGVTWHELASLQIDAALLVFDERFAVTLAKSDDNSQVLAVCQDGAEAILHTIYVEIPV